MYSKLHWEPTLIIGILGSAHWSVPSSPFTQEETERRYRDVCTELYKRFWFEKIDLFVNGGWLSMNMHILWRCGWQLFTTSVNGWNLHHPTELLRKICFWGFCIFFEWIFANTRKAWMLFLERYACLWQLAEHFIFQVIGKKRDAAVTPGDCVAHGVGPPPPNQRYGIA